MLNLHIITVGRDKDPWLSEQTEHYRKLISKYAHLDFTVVPESRYTKHADIDKAKKSEAEAINTQLRGGYLVILDVSGRMYDTRALAETLNRIQVSGKSLIEFVIGGPFGLDESLRKKGDLTLSLSTLTFSHQIVRLVLLEQLYRVLNLNAGGSYHK